MAFLEKINSWFSTEKKSNSDSVETKENTQSSLLNKLRMGRFSLFPSRFVVDVFQDEVLTPHVEMSYAKKIFFYNGFVAKAVNHVSLKSSGWSIGVESKNAATKKYLERVFESSNLRDSRQDVFKDLMVYGASYFRKISIKPQGGEDGKGDFIFYKRISMPERMYKDLDRQGNVKRYIYHTDNKNDDNFTINYYANQRKTIRGVEIKPEDVLEFKIGEGTIPAYGRGGLASAVNDAKTLFEIEKDVATNARYKSIQRHIFNFKEASSKKEQDALSNQLSGALERQNILMNRPDLEVKELGFSQREPPWKDFLSYFKSKILAPIAAQYTGEGESIKYSVAGEQGDDEDLAVKALRDIYAVVVERELKKALARHSDLFSDFKIDFSDLDVEGEAKRREEARNLWNDNVITLNEYRKMLELDLVEGEEGELRKVDLEATGVSPGAGESM